MKAAIEHCTNGIGIWSWASSDQDREPDVVMACAGDVPTLETLAAVDLLRQRFADIKIRVVNVVDLMTLQSPSEHPHGLPDRNFDSMFGTDTPVIFAYHGYPWLIHRLTYRRAGHAQFHVRGYKEEGTTTTPFDMTVRNDLDRYHLASDVEPASHTGIRYLCASFVGRHWRHGGRVGRHRRAGVYGRSWRELARGATGCL